MQEITPESIEAFVSAVDHNCKEHNINSSNKLVRDLMSACTYLIADRKAREKYITRVDTLNDKLMRTITHETEL